MRPGAVASDPSLVQVVKPGNRELPRHLAHPSSAYQDVWILECSGRVASGYTPVDTPPTCANCLALAPTLTSAAHGA